MRQATLFDGMRLAVDRAVEKSLRSVNRGTYDAYSC